MKVLHINQQNYYGGASKIALNLVKGIRKEGIESELLYFNKRSNLLEGQCAFPFLENINKYIIINKIINKLILSYASFYGDVDNPLFEFALKKVFEINPDIVHLHNIHGGWANLKSLAKLSKDIKFVLTLHDEWFLTGHCGSSVDCDGWKLGCISCNYLSRYVKLRRPITGHLRERKRKFLEEIANNGGILVTPSIWLKNRVIESGIWKGEEIKVAYNGADLNNIMGDYKEKNILRKELGLSENKLVALFCAESGTKNEDKGFDIIEEALIKSENMGNKLEIVVAGDKIKNYEVIYINGVKVTKAGYLDNSLLYKYYYAADLFLYPTKADSFGLVVLEAMAAGLPTITTEVGPIPELVNNDKTGILIKSPNAELLVKAIKYAIENPNKMQEMGKEAKKRSYLFSLQNMTTGYMKIYDECLKS